MHTHTPTKHAGICLRDLRSRQKLSQLDLALRVGVSQRHLSCIETGKARASKDMLLALLEGLDAPLSERNEALVAAGYAPVFGNRPIDHRDMHTINEVIDLMLTAQHAAPAMVLDSEWNLVKFNPSFVRLLHLLEFDLAALQATPNVLLALTAPGGLATRLLNPAEVLGDVLRRAQREALHVPSLQAMLQHIPQSMFDAKQPQSFNNPTLVTRFKSTAGELRFISTFTSFGAPLDITAASLRIEHLFPADDVTRKAFS
ncbi:MAG: helix-turn-helix domain-containing protein [Pseudomonadota bacterium]